MVYRVYKSDIKFSDDGLILPEYRKRVKRKNNKIGLLKNNIFKERPESESDNFQLFLNTANNYTENQMKDRLGELFKEETIKEIIMDTEGVKGLQQEMNLLEPTKNGRPKKDKDTSKYKANKIKELLNNSQDERVVPLYDGFDPVNGGMTMLTPLEHKFAIIFTQTGNATKSAEMACMQHANGNKTHSGKNWRKVGADIIKRPHVKQAIGMMQKKMCVAAALDASEIISNIREIAALATVSEKYEAALKANLVLGEYLGIFGKTKEERLKNVTNSSIVEVFKTGEDLIDNKNDIEKLTSSLGISSSSSMVSLKDENKG